MLLLAAGCGSQAARPERGPTLVAAGDGEIWQIDGDTGRTRHVKRPEIPGGDPPHRVVRRGGRFLLWPLRGSAFFLPSAHPDRVWLAFTDRRARVGAVREVTAGGAVTVPDARPPGWPEVATLAGLAIPNRDGGVLIWDPRRDRVVRRLGRIGDLGGAWRNLLTSCTWPCRELRITHATTGARTTIPAPPGHVFEVHAASFSPSGGRIAVPVRGSGASRRLALADPRRKTAEPVPGSRIPGGYTFVTWSASGRDVFVTGGMWSRVIKRYRLGDARATRVPARTGAF